MEFEYLTPISERKREETGLRRDGDWTESVERGTMDLKVNIKYRNRKGKKGNCRKRNRKEMQEGGKRRQRGVGMNK